MEQGGGVGQGVKWQNTTQSWSREPELTEGTWLRLMCYAHLQSHCPKFWSNGFTEFTVVFQSTPEKTEKTERLEVCATGCTMVDCCCKFSGYLFELEYDFIIFFFDAALIPVGYMRA